MPWNPHRFLMKCSPGCSLLERHIPIYRHMCVDRRKSQPKSSLPLDSTRKSSITLNYREKAGSQRSMKFSLIMCIHIMKTTPAFRPSMARKYRFINIGFSSKDAILVVWYTERNENIRIIGCRRATRSERKKYEEEAQS